MSELIMSRRMQRLDPLQEEQVRLGRANGLTKKDVAEYAHPKFNYLQMQEIRLAIENETDPRQRRIMLDPALSAEEMRQMRLALERGECLKEKKDLLWMYILAVPVLMTAGFFAACWENTGIVPHLDLTDTETVLKEGDVFDAASYVRDVSEGTLLLPQYIHTEKAGHYAAVYRLQSHNTELVRTLEITVEKKKK